MIRILIILLVWGGLLFYLYRGVKRLLQKNQKTFPRSDRRDPLRDAKKADVIDIQ